MHRAATPIGGAGQQTPHRDTGKRHRDGKFAQGHRQVVSGRKASHRNAERADRSAKVGTGRFGWMPPNDNDRGQEYWVILSGTGGMTRMRDGASAALSPYGSTPGKGYRMEITGAGCDRNRTATTLPAGYEPPDNIRTMTSTP